jgi:hypothetical protein
MGFIRPPRLCYFLGSIAEVELKLYRHTGFSLGEGKNKKVLL